MQVTCTRVLQWSEMHLTPIRFLCLLRKSHHTAVYQRCLLYDLKRSRVSMGIVISNAACSQKYDCSSNTLLVNKPDASDNGSR